MTPQFVPAKQFFTKETNPVSLYQGLWLENATTLFHAPRFIANKTKVALGIANDVAASGHEVLYISTERHLNMPKADADKLYIFTPEFESIDDKRDYADIVFEALEHAVRSTTIRTFVIDSITRIAALSFGRNASASYIMKRLVALQVKCKLSLLVLADETSRATVNSLLALADADMCLNANNDNSEKADKQPANKPSSPSTISMPYSDRVIRGQLPMTRQQRRAIERQQAKRSETDFKF